MKKIIIPPGIIVMLPCLCDHCGFETDHICEFVSVNFRYHIVTYRLICETCLSERNVREVKQFWAPIKDWEEMLANIAEDKN